MNFETGFYGEGLRGVFAILVGSSGFEASILSVRLETSKREAREQIVELGLRCLRKSIPGERV